MCLNVTGIVLAATGKWDYPRKYTAACVLGNLLTAILMRNELFGRVLYLVINTLFAKVRGTLIIRKVELLNVTNSQWTPLRFRLACTSALQHLGGIHSGCALSGFMWLVYRITAIFINHKNNHDSILIMGVITNVVVGGSIISAFPWVRNTHHK